MFMRRGLYPIMQRIRKQIRPGMVLLLLSSIVLLMTLPVNADPLAQTMYDRNVYIPLIPSGATGATPAAPIVTGDHVYGLLGQIEQPAGQRYTFYLRTADNSYFALAGQTPQIEQQIGTLARQEVYPNVKVWGEVLPPVRAGEPPLIVVTGLLGTEAPLPAQTPIAGSSVPVAVVKFAEINLYSGPGSTYPVVGKVILRQACEVTGRNTARTWLQLTCTDGQQGWVDARLVDVQGNVATVLVVNPVVPTATPTVAVTPVTPTPTPVTFRGWRMELFNNMSLSGSAVAVMDVPAINFNWGPGAPSPLPADGFSVRFSRQIEVAPAYYQFTATADDGIRVWLDGRLIINAWPANPSQSYVVGQLLAGSHDLRVEYYEQSGLANVRMDYVPVAEENYWQATYYYGVVPSGNPAFVQQEPRGQNPLDYNWAGGSPYSVAFGPNVLGNDYWSARWQGEFAFESGNYQFRAIADDGIRVYLDGLLVLNHWRDGYKDVSNRVIGVGPGQHTVTVEYYERTGNALVRIWWYRDSAYVGP